MVGYDENFLAGVKLPLPHFSAQLADKVFQSHKLSDGIIAKYPHYSIITHKVHRAPICAAVNIDQKQLKITQRSDHWKIDPRIGAAHQLNNDYYHNNPWDKGHLARRASCAWGDSQEAAQKAADETFYYSNASLQHKNFNRDEWAALENWVYDLQLDLDGRITTFSGPIYGDFPRIIQPSTREAAQVPASFFKIVCFIHKDSKKLDVRAFLAHQDHIALKSLSGRRLFDFQMYQVTIKEIEQLSGLRFADEIYTQNPLKFHPSENSTSLNIEQLPERIEVNSSEEIIGVQTTRDIIKDEVIPIYITAAMVNAAGKDRDNEWISLINYSHESICLNNWTLQDHKKRRFSLRGSLQPGEAKVFYPGGKLRLANGGGILTLHDAEGNRVDRAKYLDQTRREGRPVIFLQPQP